MTEYRPDEIVDITIKGARVTNTYGTGRGRAEAPEDTGTVLVFRMDGSRYDHSHSVNMGDPGVTVERVAPAEWPPRPGDLWRARGRLYFGLLTPHRGSGLIDLMDANGDPIPAEDLLDVGQPTLVHREGNQRGPVVFEDPLMAHLAEDGDA